MQHTAQNPNGYCPNHSTGVACPVGLGVTLEGEGGPERPLRIL